MTPDLDVLLHAYDTQLRAEAEFASALRWDRDGPVLRGVYVGGRGFIVHEAGALAGLTRDDLDELVARTLEHYRADPEITRVEWKTRGHDDGDEALRSALVAHGFVAGEMESVMIGRAEDLAVDVPLPGGVLIRRVTAEADVRAMAAMQDEVFGDLPSSAMADALLHRLALGQDDMELWVAEADGEIVCAGRLEPVTGTDFAGIWGGATRPQWRRRGIYRALTAARARSALARGRHLIQSDSTEYSRPILARAGFNTVTTTTPHEWRR